MAEGRAYRYPRVRAYAGAGNNDHLPRLGERIGDILEEVEGIGLDLESGHSAWSGREAEAGRQGG